MRPASFPLSALLLAGSLFGAAACMQAGGGCGGMSEQQLDDIANSKTQPVTVTCGPGTELKNNVCVKVGQ